MSKAHAVLSKNISHQIQRSLPARHTPPGRLLLRKGQSFKGLSRLRASSGESIGPLEALELACESEGIQLVQDEEDDEETWEDLLEDEEIAWDPTLELAEAKPTSKADSESRPQITEASHVSIEELRGFRRRGESICALDISPHGSSGGSDELADALDGAALQRIPLEDLHADAAAQLEEVDHIVVLATPKDDRRAWQAWVRLTKVFRLEQVAILKQ